MEKRKPLHIPKFENYVRLRDANYATDYYVGLKTGISRSLFYQWSKGNRVVKRTTIDKLAEFFKVPATYFYEDHEDEETKNSSCAG